MKSITTKELFGLYDFLCHYFSCHWTYLGHVAGILQKPALHCLCYTFLCIEQKSSFLRVAEASVKSGLLENTFPHWLEEATCLILLHQCETKEGCAKNPTVVTGTH